MCVKRQLEVAKKITPIFIELVVKLPSIVGNDDIGKTHTHEYLESNDANIIIYAHVYKLWTDTWLQTMPPCW